MKTQITEQLNVEVASGGHLEVHLEWAVQLHIQMVFSISKDGDSATSLGNLCQRSVTFSKMRSLVFRGNLVCFSLFLLPLIPGTAGQSLAAALHPPFRYSGTHQ